MTLGTKISATVIGVLLLGVVGSVQSLLVTRRMERILTGIVTNHVSKVRAAQEFEIVLLEQRGAVTRYILDHGNPIWLTLLESKKASFERWLAAAEAWAHTPEESQFLADLNRVYADYDMKRNEVIAAIQAGDPTRATEIQLNEVGRLYTEASGACEAFLKTNERYIDEQLAAGRLELRKAFVSVVALAAVTMVCGAGLLIFFFRGVLRPLRSMAEDARAFSLAGPSPSLSSTSQDELRVVGFYLRSLMSDLTETHSHLRRSRLELVSAEKFATLGKLAASVGHEIRNPLTSLGMRVFSIRQAVGDNPELEEDLRVVSEEIDRLERIVRSFLEFSKPPDLNLRTHEVSVLVDKALELCGAWLADRRIEIERREDAGVPLVTADAEQIKQVLLNLLRNAAEAMEEGGRVRITTFPGAGRGGQPMSIVRIQDDGPGIPPEVRERILEPFYSTKPDGTGLGLCIAARIMAQHGGWLELEPATDRGASFSVWIPAAGGADGQDPRS
jgi:signal transduction histidine kinase